jgi:transcriptional regulator GlxA family with amidase domain
VREAIPTVVFLAFDQVGILDVCGPLSVFRRANRFLGLDRQPGYDCRVMSVDGGAVTTWENIDISTGRRCRAW